MELLTTIGIAARELFAYNREMYQFDQEQRLDRDLLRLEMQVKRFTLFREDIRDLVELTVGKMDMYHAVGALSLWFCITWYTEGRIRAEAPPFILSLYWMSIAGAFVYLLLTVWLAMHASVASHSFGVRLLTRFVRLPIPGFQQINAMNPRLTDFERQRLQNMMRVPFISTAQDWQKQAHGLASVDETSVAGPDHDHDYRPVVHQQGQLQMQDLLDEGEVPLHRLHDLRKKQQKLPGKHIQLFRNLQSKWQCYDAYARVCMSLGMNQVLLSACFYIICVTLLEYNSPTTCFALILIFQSCSLAMSILDVSGVKRRKICLLWFVGSLAPVILAATEVAIARHKHPLSEIEGETESETTQEETSDDTQIFKNEYYRFAFIPFFLIAIWMVGLLSVAWPSADDKTLPRLFRSVLFVDVFALEEDTITAVGASDGRDQPTKHTESSSTIETEPQLTQERAAQADEACYVAEAALRRWEAVPAGTTESSARHGLVARLRRKIAIWRRALNNEAARIAGTNGDLDAIALLEVDNRAWNDLSASEQEREPWAGTLLGPFEHNTLASHYYYDLEGRQFVWEVPEGRDVLTLEDLEEHVESAEAHVRSVLGGDARALPSSRDMSANTSSDEDACDTAGTNFAVASGVGCLCKKSRKPVYAPERLPWFSLSYMTIILVFAWLSEGCIMMFEQFDVFKIDFPMPFDNKFRADLPLSATPGKRKEEGEQRASEEEGAARRLRRAAAAQWSFAPVEVSWPGGLYFEPRALACLPEPGGALLVGSPEALHWAPLPGGGLQPAALRLTALRAPAPPPGAAALCGPPVRAALSAPEAVVPCLMGAPTPEGIAFWQPVRTGHGRGGQAAVTLPVRGKPWRRLAGAAVRCSEVAALLADGPAGLQRQPQDPWCLLLVGWDGERLPVAALRLPAGPVSVPPAASGKIAPIFDAPLGMQVAAHRPEQPARRATGAGGKAGRGREIAAIHVEPQQGRLWALHADGALQAWNLLHARSLGRWWPAWTAQAAGTFRAAALCEDRQRSRLLVLGRHSTGGAQLLSSLLPDVLGGL